MKIKDIQIDGFGVWTGLSVDSLPEGMTLFYGPNEAGKTTLMQFVRSMLYGYTPERRDKYLPPVYGGTPGGAMRITGPGGGYQIRRHSQLTDDSSVGQLSVTGPDGLSQGQHRLSMLLGQVDEPIFTNVFAIGMRELQELGTLDDTSAADELYKLSSGLDRVSLVDVLKSLRQGRKSLVGAPIADEEATASKLANLIRKREKLRDEVQSLSRSSRRWSELASLRGTQQQEVEQLTHRIAEWEKEAKALETASGVFETWSKRKELQDFIEEAENEPQLAAEAPEQLEQIDLMIEDRREKLEEIKLKRRAIREKADQLPVSRRLYDLQGRIEAASEQATWIEALEEQIDRLETQIDKARAHLRSEAERFGMDEADRDELMNGDIQRLPDLSRQTMSTLSGPAKLVKEQGFLLKQSRKEATEQKIKSDRLGGQLRELLQRARATDLQDAIRNETENTNILKRRMQIGEHLDKLKRHYRSLEQESVDLTTTEALPLDRVLLLLIPVVLGGTALLYGLCHVLGATWFLASESDPTWGVTMVFVGVMLLIVCHFLRNQSHRSNLVDMEDCDRQIDSLRKQIREAEAEREEVDAHLPVSSQSLETQVRESEQLLIDLESALPTYHAHQAATHSYKESRAKASTAADGLRDAKRQWSRTLDSLGLSETMSPSAVRSLSDGYETLVSARRRLDEFEEEREQRRRERQTIAKRIETLYLESMETRSDSEYGDDQDDEVESSSRRRAARKSPLEQLNHLHEEIARQQHWIKRRRELKEQDLQLKKSGAAHLRSIERGEQQRRSLWAKCGVATAEQFDELVETQIKLDEMLEQHESIDQQVRSIIGTHVDYDTVERMIDGSSALDLEKRWESLTNRVTDTQQRIATLRTQQGELLAEMKHLGEDDRLSTVRLELSCLERQIEKVAERWQTLAMTSSLMEEVCGAVERERQPETLREASSFLSQLTDEKYTRIWTPLGTNKLKIDGEGKSLPLESLSRGTREAVFIALRLSLAAAYARRGVMLPLVLDDVLVNFDGERAVHAARTLKTFAELGHQVMMFTCHEHIVDIFHEIEVEVRLMPTHGEPGRATVLLPELEYEEEEVYEDEEEELEEEVLEEIEPEPIVIETQPVLIEPQPEPEPIPEPEPEIVYVERKPEPKPKPAPKPKRKRKPVVVVHERQPEPEPEPEPEYVRLQAEPIQWAWFEQESPGSQPRNVERMHETLNDAQRALDADTAESLNFDMAMLDSGYLVESPNDDQIPEDVWNRNEDGSWWNGKHVVS